MAWKKVCLRIEVGNLGIRNVVSFNQALLRKWLWRYGHEVTHLWKTVISTKYGEDQEGWSTKVCKGTHGCGLWRSIHEGWDNFSKHLSFIVGDGTHIHFWHDKWIGDNILKSLYLELYMCSADKKACNSKILWLSEGENVRVWDWDFIGSFEIGSLLHLILFLHLSNLTFP